jgi:uncharacterized DUF497 family protein
MYMSRRVSFRLGELEFIWDVGKSMANVEKHGVTFEEAATTWLDPFSIERFDARNSDDEDRWIRIGVSLRGTLLVSWSAERTASTTTLVRIIGARRATRRERRLYEQAEDD